jgi:non-specific serine/threonine protein kinase
MGELEILLTPAGHLALCVDEATEATAEPWEKRVIEGFRASASAGIFSLAATRPDRPPHPSLQFWREVAGVYLAALCRRPEAAGDDPAPIPPPHGDELRHLILAAPPMRGGEYLSSEVLTRLWDNVDVGVRGDVAAEGKGLSGWLKAHAPLWHQVGRVSFHLAENRRDPERPFAFLATYAPRLSATGRVQYLPLARALEEYAGEGNRAALVRLLAPVQTAAGKSRLVREMVESREVFQPLAWNPAEAYRFLRDVPSMEESGLLVHLPDWWRARPRPRVAVTIGTTQKERLDLSTLLDFRVELALGDKKITEEELRSLMASGDPLVQLRGEWVEVDREKLRAALEHWRRIRSECGGDGISFLEGMRLLAGTSRDLGGREAGPELDREWQTVRAGKWLSGMLAGLRDPALLEAVRKPGELRGTLRHYQEEGLAWLWFLTRLGLGACLADDMGLGKTIQVLALLLTLKQQAPGRPSILVLPASLLGNWKAEIACFSPSLVTRFIHPSETPTGEIEAIGADPGSALAGVDLVLTTYGTLLRQEWLRREEWRLAILDEAQAIKNPGARQTRAVKELRAEARIVLTGTPVENRLSDLWSLFDFLSPGLLGSTARFKGFVKEMNDGGAGYAPLRSLVGPYILRRLKTDRLIIPDLPDKAEVKAYCGLSKRQAALYARVVEELAASLGSSEGIGRKGLVLATLMRLKQICNHPSQILGDGLFDPAESGKFERLGELAEEIASRQEKVLVFTQFREMTDPLAVFLAGIFGRQGLILHGGTAVKRRQALVDDFQREEGPPYFVLSLKAGGTGLNLTAASHVIHFDRWWNPAVETQATDRAFRIGQRKSVLVHPFVCRGTVEERIDALIEEKKGLAREILGAGAETLLTEMSDADLLRTVALNVERARE